ncbi:MAG TPA: beta-propeller fold lactonase family protein [Terriglobales bacterium]|nr:beta-propeller fold lactonase family protein [Terriglobales bacterium]
MKSLLKPLQVLSLGGAVLVLCAANAQAQQYIYTNDNVAGGGNSTTALTVSAKGVVKVIKTYPTGGKSAGSSYFALSPITSAKTVLGSCLFVSNGGDSTIAAYQLNLFDGTLAVVKGSPFPDGGSGAQHSGVGLAAGGSLLFAGNTNNNSISVLRIDSRCSLKLLTTVTVPGSPAGMKVTPDKKYLIAAYIGPVDSFQIDYTTGSLTELGPFNPHGSAAGVEVSCDSTTAYFGDAAANTQVEAFSISSTGSLKEFDNFTNSNGQSSDNVLLSVDGKHLYVSNTMSNQITTLFVGSNGALTYDSTVKLNKPGLYALGLATGANGRDIFVSEQRQSNPESVGVLAANGDTVKEVPGSPFKVVKNGSDPAGLTAVPRACR